MTDEMIPCYGCEYPMKYSFAAYEPEIAEGVYPYCIRCELARLIKGIDPGDHEPGSLSKGTPTMRARGKMEWGDS